MRRLGFWLFIILLISVTLFGAKNLYLNTNATVNKKNIILLGWDGAGRNRVKENLNQNKLPVLKKLSSDGSLVAIDILRTTDSRAGWAQILTGYEPEITSIFSNKSNQPIPRGYTLFERLARYYDSENFLAAAVIGKGIADILPKYEQKSGGSQITTDCSPDDESACQKAIEIIEQNKDKQFFLFVHFEDIDMKGHLFGEDSQAYRNALIATDTRTGKIITKLKDLILYDHTLIYIVADHGFDKEKKSHEDAPYVFLCTNDPMVIRRGERADIAPTILEQMGLNLNDINPPLSGHSLTKPHIPPVW